MRLLIITIYLLSFHCANAQQFGDAIKSKGRIYFPCDFDADVKFVVQSDGKIVIAGNYGKGDNSDIFITRYLPTGELDISFAKNGIALIDILGFQDLLVSMNVLSDDKIVIGAVADDEYSYRTLRNRMTIMKFNADGNYDLSFGDKGRILEYHDPKYKGLMSTEVQPDGKIAGIRCYDSNNQFDFGVVRFNYDGSADETFGLNGRISGSVRKFDDPAMDLAIQSDGKIVIVGQSQTGPPPSRMITRTNPIDVYVARFNSDGSSDQTFGENGKLITMIKKGFNLPKKIVIAKSGNILVTGSVTTSKTKAYAPVFCFMENGWYDTTFAGKGFLPVSYGNMNVGTDLKLLSNDDFYLAGTTIKKGSQYAFISRFKENGIADTSFNKKGTVILNDISYNPKIWILQDKKTLMGSIVSVGKNYYYMLAQFQENGKLDLEFGGK